MGMLLRVYIPEDHQSAGTQRIVNLGAGIIGTMAALVLGLLIASERFAGPWTGVMTCSAPPKETS
jgi:hypothetical protein